MVTETKKRRTRTSGPVTAQPSIPSNEIRKGKRFQGKLYSLLTIGLLFHLAYMLSIFDIYFRSPLIHGMDPIVPSFKAPADRLVLFVGDGCRADKAFEMKPDGTPRMPYLHSIAKSVGSFGVSHTRVPTESRPGHIAMIAGFYEDVSAVTKGWKSNPVDYDHLLARAKFAWSFGAPEIVDLFAGPNVHGQHYAPEMIDFATNDAKSLDKWSFDRLKELIEAASVDHELETKLKSDQVIIFVHLLGLDTNGHAFKPHSKEYLENVEFVDEGIKKSVEMLEKFYNHDGKTAYIYTADHGMSDAGTHGDGNPDNTRTPLVAWGAGVSTPETVQPIQNGDDHDEFSKDWNLSNWIRKDINQADMTPLMATLAGFSIPVNSEGILPLKILSGTKKMKCNALLDNCRQIFASYKLKEELKKIKEPLFKPFKVSADQIESKIRLAEELIQSNKFDGAQKSISDTINDSLDGLKYLHKYDSFLLKTVCSFGYLGWILYSLSFVLKHYTELYVNDQEGSNIFTSLIFGSFATSFTVFLAAKGSPIQYFIYTAFTLGFWHQIIQSRKSLFSLAGKLFSNIKSAPYILGYIAGLEALVLTFFKREILAVINMAIALALLVRYKDVHPVLTTIWFIVCTSMSAFPFFSPIKLANEKFYSSGIVAIVLTSLFSYKAISTNKTMKSTIQFYSKTLIIIASGYLSKNSDYQLKQKLGLPLWNQNAAWAILSYAILSPLLVPGKKAAMERFLDLFMTFAPAYILLSISYEPLFYACFGLQLAMWILLESSPTQKKRGISLEHLWVCFGFLFFVNLAFFGTGNMASVSSFTLESVYRFITVFSPFSMAALLILKLLLPFGLLSAAFGLLALKSGTSTVSLILLVLATTDIMTLNFFHLVKDHGSWLEIGTSISHFVIASSLIIFTLILAGLSNILLSGVQINESDQDNAYSLQRKTQ